MKGFLLIAAFVVMSAQASADPVRMENARTLSAKVVSVDQNKRLVTLQSDDGRNETVEVSPDVQNFAQIRPGDNVVVRYYESLAAQIHKPGDTLGDVREKAVAARAPEGTKPGGLVGSTVTSTVVIEAVDKSAQTVTFTGEDGQMHTVAVKKPEARNFVAGLKKGDEVNITYSQALAVSVEPSE